MKHESFKNEQMAERLNEAFVNIKVDRGEQPDIEHLYDHLPNADRPLTIIHDSGQGTVFFRNLYHTISQNDQTSDSSIASYLMNWTEKISCSP